MGKLLPRGFLLADGSKVRKTLAEGECWEIIDTNQETLALAVTEQQYHVWITDLHAAAPLLENMTACSTCRVLQARSGYLISSLRQGPFPQSTAQIDAFSTAFRKAMESGALANVEDAVYLEEYALILPVGHVEKNTDNETLYGQWLTGGLAVRAASITELSRFLSWIPREHLEHFVEQAGFQLRQDEQPTARAQEARAEEQMMTGMTPQNLPKKDMVFSLPGRPELEQFFRENIIEVVQNREAYARMGISFPGATVLYGPPGSGKTYAVGKLAEFLNWPRFDIDSGTIGSSFIHDTSKKISGVFQAAMNAAPSVLVIDEMEAFLSQRNGGDPGNHHLEEVAEFLRRIPEAVEKGVLIFAMTNMLDSIDPAILRRGRFDHIIKVDLASAEEIEGLLKKRFQELPVEENVDVAPLAKALANRPMSDIAYVLKEAGRLAVKRNLEKIDSGCIQDVVDRLPKKKEKPRIGF